MTQSSRRMHGGEAKGSVCGDKRVMCGDSKCLWPFSLQFRRPVWRSYRTWIGIDRNITPTRPPTLSHQTSHTVFHPHLFHWSSDYRKAEATYGCVLLPLLQLPLGQSSWPDPAAPLPTHTHTLRAAQQEVCPTFQLPKCSNLTSNC